MIDICPNCGNYDYDKTVADNAITCPKCGHSWDFLKLPLFIVTGASGVGKSTTVQALQKLSRDFVCLESDMIYNLMPHETPEDYMAQTEAMMAFARDVMQCGRPTVWTRAGNIDMLSKAYGTRFFSGIYVLALTASDEELRRRMTEGRGIADPGWIQSSIDYNRYFMEHDSIGDVQYDALDISGLTADQAAGELERWALSKL